MLVDQDKTLEELEGDKWIRPRFSSYVVATCDALRRKRLRDLTDEQLRLGIGQQMGVAFLVPVALERLNCNPLTSGDMYEGALLKTVLLAVDKANLSPDQLKCLEETVCRFHEASDQLDPDWREYCLPEIQPALNHYQQFRDAARACTL